MSAVAVGVGVGAVASAGFGIGAWVVSRRRGEAADLKRADAFARAEDLALPPELVAPLAGRLRRRAVSALLLGALIEGPALGIISFLFWRDLNAPLPAPGTHRIPFPGPTGLVMVALPLAVAAAIAGLLEVARVGREVFARGVLRPAPTVRLRDAVAPWLIRTVRLLTVLPPLVLTAWAALTGHVAQAPWALPLLLLSGAGVWAVERLQAHLLNHGRVAGVVGELPQEAAFDDALRVVAVLAVLSLAPSASALACGIYARSLSGQMSAPEAFFGVAMLGVLPMFLNSAVNSKQVKRYYRRSVPKPPAPPETAAC